MNERKLLDATLKLFMMAVGLVLLLMAASAPFAEDCPPYDESDYSYDRDKLAFAVWLRKGRFFSEYDNQEHDWTSDLDIEHRVARRLAHNAGMCHRSAEDKKEFANDLDNITFATGSVNSSKGSDGPDGWTPDFNQCHFVLSWERTMKKWNLTISPEDAAAVDKHRCEPLT